MRQGVDGGTWRLHMPGVAQVEVLASGFDAAFLPLPSSSSSSSVLEACLLSLLRGCTDSQGVAEVLTSTLPLGTVTRLAGQVGVIWPWRVETAQTSAGFLYQPACSPGCCRVVPAASGRGLAPAPPAAA